MGVKGPLLLHRAIYSVAYALHLAASALWALVRPLFSRWAFEKLNETDPYSQSFRGLGWAHACFEVASQGEFQQVVAVLEKLLEEGLRVELIYCSPSLERDVSLWKKRYSPHQLRCLRLPLLGVGMARGWRNVFWWVTSEHLALVRSDFYPHLMLLAISKRSAILAAPQGRGPWGRFCEKAFDLCVRPWGEGDYVADFRVASIAKRLNRAHQTLKEKGQGELFEFLQKRREKVLILGSAYRADASVIGPDLLGRILAGDVILVVAPHHLGAEQVEALVREFSKVVPISEGPSSGRAILVRAPGVLCELYQACRWAYVGGGFERSVHSVLEPFLAGALVVCGPRVGRSTEVSLVRSRAPGRIKILGQRGDLGACLENFEDRALQAPGPEQWGPREEKVLEEFLSHWLRG